MASNEKTILDIANSIQHHRKLETDELKSNDKNLAVGLSNVKILDNDLKIWLTTKPYEASSIRRVNITGYPTTTEIGEKKVITHDGNVVNKNSKFGELLIRNYKGTHTYDTPKGQQQIEIFNFSSFIPNPHKAEAEDLVLNISEPKPRRFKRLSELLEIFKKSEVSIQDLEDQEEKLKLNELIQHEERENELRQIAERKEEEKKKRDAAFAEMQSFIRKSAELRHQPILDPWQEEVKRDLIYNGTMIIEGGPGTGKTTSLIQRIKFLTDEHAMLGSQNNNSGFDDEGYKSDLTEAQKRVLFENDRNWIFFTPNELLKLFLQNNMANEGLKASNNRVLIWKDYLSKLIKEYNLVNTETQNPFLFLRKNNEKYLFLNNSTSVKSVISSFEKFFLSEINETLLKLAKIDVSDFSWKIQGQSIQNYINNQEKDYSFDGLIRLYFNLQEQFKDEVKELTVEFNDILNISAASILKEYNNNSQFKEHIEVFLIEWKKSLIDIEDTEDIEDQELEDNNGDIESFFYGKIKVLIKNIALSNFDKTVKLNSKYRDFNNLIAEYVKVDEISSLDKIGELAYFSKYFVRITRGVISNIFSLIPKTYKNYRKNGLSVKSGFNNEILEYLVKDEKSRNKRLHPQEQSLLIYFINNLIRRSYRVSKLKTRKINHAYFNAFFNSSVPVIGIDEASDFHIIDILAMHSLSDLEISSVTLSGDIMQRLTDNGIRNWNSLKPFIKPLDIKQLYVSYRQSPTLLKLAGIIYQKAMNKEAEYISYMEQDTKEPKPLMYESKDESDKIEWIAKRILDIHKAYGNLIPSIAIFLPNESNVEEFAVKLSDMDELADVGISVRASKDGQSLGDKNMVRVFPIDYIKGMEFEAAFFHNLHELSSKYNNEEMILKTLYVGLSRATFYLGVTIDEQIDNLEFLADYFETEQPTWR